MAKASKKDRRRDVAAPSVVRPQVQRLTGPAHEAPAAPPTAAVLTGAKKIKAKCCRSRPRCKGCPVVLMRAERLQESGLSGKDLKRALKQARAA